MVRRWEDEWDSLFVPWKGVESCEQDVQGGSGPGCRPRSLEQVRPPSGRPFCQCRERTVPTLVLAQVHRRASLGGGRSVFASAIVTGHRGFAGYTARTHPLVKRFLRGALRSRPPLRRAPPCWELQVVLDGLSGPPFEPLERAVMDCLSIKTAILLALASAKRAGDLCALSVHPTCLSFGAEDGLLELWPNPAFLPKVVTSAFRSRVIRIRPFFPPPHSSELDARRHFLCPVRALRRYIERTAGFRRTDQLFVAFGALEEAAWYPANFVLGTLIVGAPSWVGV
ncbi:hypothetical protein WMY93_011282 [Mugilogobius chulae]|uniref:Uncharacterized protein n=1 Tax=Mugilogobius chulae TaxID=88201 RepID=A0AAW0P5E8_9GOBI